MPTPKVSVIVPAYNAQKTIQRCVDSILNQDFHDLELILMDDGSKDDTPAILDAYAQRDDRVRVVHKPNSGVSDTRNQALDLARGEWVQFLDSDDWIVPEATKLLEHYLGSVAKAYDLELRDVLVVAFAMLSPTFGSRAELADFVGVSQVTLGRSIAKLRSRKLLHAETLPPEDKDAPRAIQITLLDAAQPLCDAIRQALRDADRVRYDGLAQQEADRVRHATHKGTANIRRLLG